ncbi:hypothetical protein ACM614_20940 [Streptomyces sp. 12297]
MALPDGRWRGNQVNTWVPEKGDPLEPDDAAGALAVVADDAAQSTITKVLWQVWPLCAEHRIGVHPRPAGTAKTGTRPSPDAGAAETARAMT